MIKKITKEELEDRAREKGIDTEMSYEELRKEIDINKCRWCQEEFLIGWSEKFCTDSCEVEYTHEFY